MAQPVQDFVRRYPLSLPEIIATPVIFRESLPFLSRLPAPNRAIVRDLAEFAGHSYGALRTALSRARAVGEIVTIEEGRGDIRLRRTETTRAISDVVQVWDSRPEGFVIAVFSFHKDNEMERRAVRELLRHFGFKRIAQNTYINGMIDTAGVEAELKKEGVFENLFLFRCSSVEEPSLVKRLKAVFDLTSRSRALASFLGDLQMFLTEPGMSFMDFSRRMLYMGPVHYRICFVEEPPIPKSFLPVGYPLHAINALVAGQIRKRAKDLAHYYRTLCG